MSDRCTAVNDFWDAVSTTVVGVVILIAVNLFSHAPWAILILLGKGAPGGFATMFASVGVLSLAIVACGVLVAAISGVVVAARLVCGLQVGAKEQRPAGWLSPEQFAELSETTNGQERATTR